LSQAFDLPFAAARAKELSFPLLGSCNELEYDLLLARDLKFLPPASHARLAGRLEEVWRMLPGRIESVTA